MAGFVPAAQYLAVRRLTDRAQLPTRAFDADAGVDLRALDDVVLAAGGRASVPTGLAVAVPVGFVGLIAPRSGLASKFGVTVLNAPGVVDAGFTGEVHVVLYNSGASSIRFEAGTRIAQLLLFQLPQVFVVEVDRLPESDRGERGFGSTDPPPGAHD